VTPLAEAAALAACIALLIIGSIALCATVREAKRPEPEGKVVPGLRPRKPVRPDGKPISPWEGMR
jgi:hypothetical protein